MGKQRDFSQRGRSKFSSKIFADKMMEYIFAVAVALHTAVAMTPEDFEKGVGRSAREFILPETDGDRLEEVFNFLWGVISGGGNCSNDRDCNAIIGYCNEAQPIPRCEATLVGFVLVWEIVSIFIWSIVSLLGVGQAGDQLMLDVLCCIGSIIVWVAKRSLAALWQAVWYGAYVPARSIFSWLQRITKTRED